MPSRAASTGDILTRAGIFHGIDRDFIDAVALQLRPVTFPRRHAVFAEGDECDELYIIADGKVKIGRSSDSGRENLLTVLGPSDMFGELSVFDPGPRTSSATTITEVQALAMNHRTLKAWIAEQPEVGERLLRVLARRLRRANDNLADLVFTDASGRVAKQLLHLAQRFGVQEGGALRLTHDLTQEELAHLVGASRETVNKALSEFAHRGWIQLDGKSVLICDSARLARRAGAPSPEPTYPGPAPRPSRHPAARTPKVPELSNTAIQRRLANRLRPRRVVISRGLG